MNNPLCLPNQQTDFYQHRILSCVLQRFARHGSASESVRDAVRRVFRLVYAPPPEDNGYNHTLPPYMHQLRHCHYMHNTRHLCFQIHFLFCCAAIPLFYSKEGLMNSLTYCSTHSTVMLWPWQDLLSLCNFNLVIWTLTDIMFSSE